MVDVQIRFSAEILPFGFESERKERLILDAPPPKYYTAFDFWEEETPVEPQIREEKRENDKDSIEEKPQLKEIEVKEQINIENNNNQMEISEEELDEQWSLQIEAEIAFDRQMELTMEEFYYDSCDEYEEDYEFAFFHAKKANPKRLRNTSHYKKEKINPDRYVNAYTQKREEQRTELIAQNHSFAKSNAFAEFGRFIPVPRVYTTESTSVAAASNYTQYNRANNPNIPQSELDMINQAIQASLRAQSAPVVANGLTANQLLELQTRDLTPEDYELLLALDESVKKKTLTKTQCASFPSRTLDEEGAKCLTSNPCSICFGDYECGEKVRSLPCDHTFHNECIDQWLTTSAISCPLCKTSLEAFFEE